MKDELKFSGNFLFVVDVIMKSKWLESCWIYTGACIFLDQLVWSSWDHSCSRSLHGYMKTKISNSCTRLILYIQTRTWTKLVYWNEVPSTGFNPPKVGLLTKTCFSMCRVMLQGGVHSWNKGPKWGRVEHTFTFHECFCLWALTRCKIWRKSWAKH
jgi:hypothetical protein